MDPKRKPGLPQPSELLAPERIVLELAAADYEGCMTGLVRHLVAGGTLTEAQGEALEAALLERERMAVTCIGRGVGIPHAYLPALPRVLSLFARLHSAVAHGTPDGVPVDLVFLLAGPQEAQRHHLPLLAHIVRMLHGPYPLERLRAADSPAAVLEAWREAERLHG